MATTITREATWNKVGTNIREANSVKEAMQISGLDYEVVKAPIYLSSVSSARTTPSCRMRKLSPLLIASFRKA